MMCFLRRTPVNSRERNKVREKQLRRSWYSGGVKILNRKRRGSLPQDSLYSLRQLFEAADLFCLAVNRAEAVLR